MFGWLRRKGKRIRVVCPACRSVQEEPALAISTFCRACGTHFHIEGGNALPAPDSGAAVELLRMVDEEEESENRLEVAGSEQGEEDFPEEREGFVALGAEAKSANDEEMTNRGLGQALMENAGDSPEKGGPEIGSALDGEESEEEERRVAPLHSVLAEGPSLGEKAQPVAVLKEGSMSALLRSSDEPAEFHPKMPPGFVPGARSAAGEQKVRKIRCFSCFHRQTVSLSAESTQCGRCSVYISLLDHEINTSWTQGLRTRGNLRIRKAGSVLGGDVACHNLEVEGRLSAAVDCSGDAIFRNSAHVMGQMYCDRLVIEKNAEVVFPQGVKAGSVEVFGTLVGDVSCSGTVEIHSRGAVEGRVGARAVNLKDGGKLSGSMEIEPDLEIHLPEIHGLVNPIG